MKSTTHLFLFVAFILGFIACEAPPTEKKDDPLSLQGTWKMTAYQPQDTAIMVPPEMHSIKIYTKDRFFMTNYRKEDSSMSMALGGPYTSTEDAFSETIAYYSNDSTFPGTVIPYGLTLSKQSYHQSGAIPARGYRDAIIIEEDFERIEPSVANSKGTNPLIGVWKLEKAAYGDPQKAEALEPNMEALKVFTPEHFYTTTYNTQTGKFDYAVFGTYRIEGNTFHETIVTAHDPEMIGMEIIHEWEGDENSLMQTVTMVWDGEDFLIEEYFSRVE